MVSQSWCRIPSGANDQIFITAWQLWSYFVGCHIWRDDRSAFCICCWPLPAQSFSGPSPLGLATISYCLRFETSIFVASYDSQGHGGGIRPALLKGGRKQSRAVSYCRQPASTVMLGIEARWDPWPYIFSVLRLLFFFSFIVVPPLIRRKVLGFLIIGVPLLHLIPPEVRLK
jgi:hypothetical protein